MSKRRHFPEYTEQQARLNATRFRYSPNPESGTPEFWMALTLCGTRGTIAADDEEVDCLRCVRAWEGGNRPLDELEDFDVFFLTNIPGSYRRALRVLRDRHRDEFESILNEAQVR